jgi:hypothetical protein
MRARRSSQLRRLTLEFRSSRQFVILSEVKRSRRIPRRYLKGLTTESRDCARDDPIFEVWVEFRVK